MLHWEHRGTAPGLWLGSKDHRSGLILDESAAPRSGSPFQSTAASRVVCATSQLRPCRACRWWQSSPGLQIAWNPSAGEERPLMLALDTASPELSSAFQSTTQASAQQQWVHLTRGFVQQVQLGLLCRSCTTTACTSPHWYHQHRPGPRPQGCKSTLQTQGAGKLYKKVLFKQYT